MSKLRIDPYILAILAMVATASVFPVSGQSAVVAGYAVNFAIGLLFFLHGARLAPSAALAGARNWKLHAVVMLATFALFPALGLLARAALPGLLPGPLWTGFILLCVLPSTVQSSIAFTSIARGNVAAALCSATASNLLGMGLTPLLAGFLLSSNGGFSMHGLLEIVEQLLLPFAAGQLARPLIGAFVARHKKVLGWVDRGSILMVVYVAFSEGVTQGIWHQLSPSDLAALVVLDCALLAAVMTITLYGSRLMGFSRADEITIVFCGSKKSLASGLPMATVLMAGPSVGLVVLPLMLFHQVQLMVCAAMAKRYANTTPVPIEALAEAAD
jgi:sodium/bile acid cotransporter 7